MHWSNCHVIGWLDNCINDWTGVPNNHLGECIYYGYNHVENTDIVCTEVHNWHHFEVNQRSYLSVRISERMPLKECLGITNWKRLLRGEIKEGDKRILSSEMNRNKGYYVINSIMHELNRYKGRFLFRPWGKYICKYINIYFMLIYQYQNKIDMF